MSLPAHLVRLRPLAAGLAILNPQPHANVVGTLGWIWSDAAGTRWALSCYHVLCRSNGSSPAPTGEPIYQPADQAPANLIGYTDEDRADAGVDCAAIPLLDEVPSTAAVPTLGLPTAPAEPSAGMLVMKVGLETRITYGTILEVRSGMEVLIAPAPQHPAGQPLAEPGDSGAVWFDCESRAPVGLHTGLRWGGQEYVSVSRSLPFVLDTLGLVTPAPGSGPRP